MSGFHIEAYRPAPTTLLVDGPRDWLRQSSTISASAFVMLLDGILRIRVTIGSHCSRVVASMVRTRPMVWQRLHLCWVSAQASRIAGEALDGSGIRESRRIGSPHAAIAAASANTRMAVGGRGSRLSC